MAGSLLTLRRRSLRLDGFDYSRVGWYFVTVCCDKQVVRDGGFPLRSWSGPFGTVQDEIIHHSSLGALVELEWERLRERFAWAELDESVVMPDHLHGLVYLGHQQEPNEMALGDPVISAGSLPKLVQAFKSTTTWRAKRELALVTYPGRRLWQRNYYESIIRDDRHLAAVRRYIINNPARMTSPAGNPTGVAIRSDR